MAVLELLPAGGAPRVSAGAGAAARACVSRASGAAAGPRAALRPRLRVSCASASVVSLFRRAASLRSSCSHQQSHPCANENKCGWQVCTQVCHH